MVEHGYFYLGLSGSVYLMERFGTKKLGLSLFIISGSIAIESLGKKRSCLCEKEFGVHVATAPVTTLDYSLNAADRFKQAVLLKKTLPVPIPLHNEERNAAVVMNNQKSVLLVRAHTASKTAIGVIQRHHQTRRIFVITFSR